VPRAESTDGTAWRRWREQTFGTDFEIWHDGLALENLESLDAAERAKVVRLCLEGLRQTDWVAAEVLAALGATDSVPAIDRAFSQAAPDGLSRIAVALRRLTGKDGYAAPVIALLRSTQHWSLRAEAARALGAFSGPEAIAALEEAAADPEYLVRVHACNSLLKIWGHAPADVTQVSRLFGAIKGEGLADASQVEAALQSVRNETQREVWHPLSRLHDMAVTDLPDLADLWRRERPGFPKESAVGLFWMTLGSHLENYIHFMLGDRQSRSEALDWGRIVAWLDQRVPSLDENELNEFATHFIEALPFATSQERQLSREILGGGALARLYNQQAVAWGLD